LLCVIHRSALAVWLAALAIHVPAALAQADRASVSGTVTDPGKGVVPGAKVAIGDLATGVSHSTITNAAGAYTISSLAVGDYTVTIAAPGFSTLRFERVTLEVGETRILNAALTLSSVDSQVSVVDTVADLDQSSAQIGSVIKGSQTQDLPLNGRSWVRLLTLVPGAIDGASGTEDQVRFAGLSQEDNNFHFDGVDATGINHQFEKVDLRLQLSTEAIAEFRVNSALFSADQGGSAGGQVEIVSRSGTNGLQGSAWEFFRNSIFDARPWGSGALPAFKLNNFGANLGGAIIKNKLFFFANQESLRQILAQPLSGLAPTAAYRAQAIAINPALAPIMNAYPAGTVPTKDPNALSWIGSGRSTINEDSGIFRADYNASSKTLLFLRFSTDFYAATFPNGAQVDTSGRVLPAFNSLDTPNAVLDLQHTFSPSVINDVRAGFNRANYLEGGPTSLPYGVSIPGFSTLSLPSASNRDDNSYSFVDDATFVEGRHTIKTGASTRRVQENKASPNVDQGTYSWNSETAFLSTAPNLLNSYSFNGQVPVTGQRMTEVAGYILDDFRPLPNLTFNIGLRYDYFGVDHEVEGRGIVVDPMSCPNVVCPAGSQWYNPNTKDFEPRVSIAWSPKALHGKTVIRTGWGIFDGIGQFGHLGGPIGNVTAKYTLNQTTAPGLVFPITPFLNNIQYSASYSAQDRNRKDLSLNEWSVSIQHEILRDTTVQVAYYGSEGAHLWTNTTLNGVNPATGLRPYPAFSSIAYNTTNGVSNFNALQTGLQRRLSTGLLISASYQWSHAIDDGAVGGAEASTPENVSCRSCERASSAFDVRSYFSASGLWRIPVGKGHSLLGNASGLTEAFFSGWQLGGIGTAKTGLPLNVTITRTASTLPDQLNSSQRPNYVAGQPLYPSDQTPQNWLNAAAFVLPAAGTWGNAGRDLVRAPGIWQLDLSLQKRFQIREHASISFRAEAFNIFNRAQYGSPVVSLPGANFGLIQSSYNSNPTGSGTPREIQLMLRVDF
jgi:hypothetical protein